MNGVINLLSGSSVKTLTIKDILTFLALYPEWLVRIDNHWHDIVRIRNHIFKGKELDRNQTTMLLVLFLCDLVQISLDNMHIFEPFDITDGSEQLYTKYKNAPLNLCYFEDVSFNFKKRLVGKELSGVSFLLNILREVIEC